MIAAMPMEGDALEMTDPGRDSWRGILARYKVPSLRAALTQLADTALPFAAVWYLMLRCVQSPTLPYVFAVLLAVPAAFLFTRLFIIQHDCGHGSFFPSRTANNFVGSILGVLTLFPYGYWRRTHAIHHATSGNLDRRELGDVATLTVKEYRALSRARRIGYRLYRNPLILFGLGPTYQFVLKHRYPFDTPFGWKKEWASVLWTNLGIVAAVALAWSTIGWQAFLWVQAPIIFLAGAIGVWLFYVQHQFEDTYWDRAEGWDFYRAGAHGSSFYDLPPLAHWLTGNIGYHHIHHLSSQIPNYHLARCFRENPEMQRVTRLKFWESFKCAQLSLWDEEKRELVSFRGA